MLVDEAIYNFRTNEIFFWQLILHSIDWYIKTKFINNNNYNLFIRLLFKLFSFIFECHCSFGLLVISYISIVGNLEWNRNLVSYWYYSRLKSLMKLIFGCHSNEHFYSYLISMTKTIVWNYVQCSLIAWMVQDLTQCSIGQFVY